MVLSVATPRFGSLTRTVRGGAVWCRLQKGDGYWQIGGGCISGVDYYLVQKYRGINGQNAHEFMYLLRYVGAGLRENEYVERTATEMGLWLSAVLLQHPNHQNNHSHFCGKFAETALWLTST